MAAATAEVKARAPKAIAVSKLISGKLVTELAKSEVEKLRKAKQLCDELDYIASWQNESRAAAEALDALIAKVNGLS